MKATDLRPKYYYEGHLNRPYSNRNGLQAGLSGKGAPNEKPG
jgi:hypothetical protein